MTANRLTSALQTIANAIATCLYIALAALAIMVFAYTLMHDALYLRLYRYLYVGAGLFVVAYIVPRFRYNTQWWMRFTHELTHTLMAIAFMRKIKRFIVKDNECYVSFSTNRFNIGRDAITLSPYCLPIFTLIILPYRYMGQMGFMPAFDVLLGYTFMFHLITFMKQTRPWQSDIRSVGLVRSYAFIIFVRLACASLLLATVRGGVLKGIARTFVHYPANIINNPGIMLDLLHETVRIWF